VRGVRLSSEAIDELVEAAAWYQAQRRGLESEFLAELDRLLPVIGSSPESFPRLLDVPEDLNATLSLRGDLHGPRDACQIIAVAHAKRRPGYWLNRVEPEEGQ